MARKTLAIFALTAGFSLSACGGGAHENPQITQPVGNPVFSSQMIGQTWTFRDGQGCTMIIEQQPPPSQSNWITGENIVWHYTKSCDDDPTGTRAYWHIGIPSAELWFMLHKQPDGSWIHNHMLIKVPESCSYCNGATSYTDDVAAAPGDATPYLIVPSGTGDVQTQYVHWRAIDVLTWQSVIAGEASSPLYWRTLSYKENVSTPVFTGEALVSEQWELCSTDGIGCDHEKWYFAPGLGLVKVQPFDIGEGGAAYDPKQDMIRIK